MLYTFPELLWLFLIYSFAGWLLETIASAVKQKMFVNRGLVNLPFCILYGISAVFIIVLASDLDGIWLFIGSTILATFFEWVASHLIEACYHERWWDYSQMRFNVDGYISLGTSLFWGVLAFLGMTWGNDFFLSLFRIMPNIAQLSILWPIYVLLVIDILATLLVVTGRTKNVQRWQSVDQWLFRYTLRLEKWIYYRINKRIDRAYHPKAKEIEACPEKATVFAYGCSFHKIIWLFVIGAFLGDITETIFCRITAGVWMSRSSVVWGPFSIVWGLAIAIATLLLYKYRNRSDGLLFIIGTVLGGVYEYACSVVTELVFGKVFWDYSKIPFNLGGRINLLYCFFWGIAAVVWMKVFYPKMSHWIEKVPMKAGKIISWVLIVFMCCNMVVSGLALIRSTERLNGVPAEKKWQQIMDERFDDDRLGKIYPNMINVD